MADDQNTPQAATPPTPILTAPLTAPPATSAPTPSPAPVTDWAAEAAKFGGTVAQSTPMATAPPQTKDWAAEAAKFGGTVVQTASPESWEHKLVLGPNTAAGDQGPQWFQRDMQSLSQIAHGNIRQGASGLWDTEKTPFHVIPGSPIEKLIQTINPNFKGAATPQNAQESRQGLGTKPVIDPAQFIDKDKHPIAKALVETAQSFTSPQTLAVMAATGGAGMVDSPAALGMANRLISAGFAGQSIAAAYKELKGFKKAYDSGNAAEAEYQLTHAILSGALTALMTQHALTGKSPAENAWTETGAKADAALGNAIKGIGSAVSGVASHTTDLIPNKSPEISPADQIAKAADNLYKAIKPGKVAVADDFRQTLNDAMPQLSVIANKNPNVSTPVEMADAIENHRTGIDAQLKQKAFDMRGLPEARMDGVEAQVQEAMDQAWQKAERKYTPDEIAKAESTVMKQFGLETKMEKDPDTGVEAPTVVRTGPTPDLYGAENIRQRFNDDTRGTYGQPGNVPPAEIFAKQVAGQVLRDAIDAKFEDLGVEGVKEWRKQETGLIDVRDALRDAAKRSEDAGKWSVWDSIIKRKGWGAMPAVVGAVVGGAPGAVIGELAHMGMDYLRDQQTNPNVLTSKAIKNLTEAGPSKDAAIPQKTGVKTTVPKSVEEDFGDVENPNRGVAEVTAAPKVNTKAEGPQWERTISGEVDGKPAGKVGYHIDPEGRAQVFGAHVDPKLRNQGVGTELYRNMIRDAKEQGAKVLTSDSTNTKPGALRVWEKLGEEGYPVEKITHPDGKPGYSLDLSKVGETDPQKIVENAGGVYKGKNSSGQVEITLPRSMTENLPLSDRMKDFVSVTLPEKDITPQSVKEAMDRKVTEFGGAPAAVGKDLLNRLPENKGSLGTVRDDIHHELGHAIVGKNVGMDFSDGIVSDRHPLSKEIGAVAAIEFNMDKWGADPETHVISWDKLRPHLDDFLTMIMGGGLGEEHFSNIPWESNEGIGGDLGLAHKVLAALGYSYDGAVEKIDAAKIRAKDILTKPGISDIVKSHSGTREENLPDTYHMSKERVEQILKEIKDGQDRQNNAVQGNRTEDGTESGRTNQETVARGKGTGSGGIRSEVPKLKAKDKKVNLPLGAGIATAAGLGALAGATKKEEEAPKQASVAAAPEVDETAPQIDIPTLLDEAAKDNKIPPALLYAQAQQESQLDPDAVSKKGAKGIMQLMPKTAKALGVDPEDTEDNIHGGALYLRQLHHQFGHWDKALAAYNAGPDRVQKAIDDHGEDWLDYLPNETQKYVHKILRKAAK